MVGVRMMQKIGCFLVLLLLSSCVVAAGSTAVTTSFTDFTIPSSDLSVHYLGLLFGPVSNVLQGHGSNLLGQIFLVFNQGIMILASLWLAYTSINLVFSSAIEGSMTSPQRKPALIFLRLGVGFALIIPSAASGYSAIQDIVMKVAVEGVALADDVWDYSLQYLQNGGFIYAESDAHSIAAQMPAVQKAFSQDDGPVAKILLDEMCMHLSTAYSEAHPTDPLSRSGAYHAIWSSDHQTLYFPGFSNHANWLPSMEKTQPAACGYVQAFKPVSAEAMKQQLSVAALEQLVDDLDPTAMHLANNIARQLPASSSDISAATSTLSNSLLDYLSVVQPAVALAPKKIPDFFNQAYQRGWYSAGGFYWDLTQYNDHLSASLGLDKAAPMTHGGAHSLFERPLLSWLQQANSVDALLMPHVRIQLYDYASNSAVGSSAGAMAAEHQITIGGYADCEGGACVAVQPATEITENTFEDTDSYSGGVGISGFGSIPDAVASLAGDVYQYESSPSAANQSEFYNPIAFVMHLGTDCLQSAGEIWSDGVTEIAAWSAVAGICSSVSPGATIMQALMSWLTPLYMGAALALFVSGFMMAFYAPLYPYLLFLFGAVSWILYVLEAMVAAPLVCFGLTHPEGHDFLGRSEQALMLLLGVFLRPALMIIGFLCSLVLSYITFAMVNYSFSHVLRSVFDGFVTPSGVTLNTHSSDNVAVINSIFGVIADNTTGSAGQSDMFTGHNMTDFILIPILFVFYGLVVIEVVNQCFSLIHVLPDQVLRWIGGPVQQDRTEQMVQKVGQQVQAAAKQIGEIGGNATLGQAQAAGSVSGSSVGFGVGLGQAFVGASTSA